MLNKLRNQQGFTLIELLVVILIVGIMAAIALPAFLGQRQAGKDKAAINDAPVIRAEMERYRQLTGSYEGATKEKLLVLQPDLDTDSDFEVQAADSEYQLIVWSKGDEKTAFSTWVFKGKVMRKECSRPGEGKCSKDGTW